MECACIDPPLKRQALPFRGLAVCFRSQADLVKLPKMYETRQLFFGFLLDTREFHPVSKRAGARNVKRREDHRADAHRFERRRLYFDGLRTQTERRLFEDFLFDRQAREKIVRQPEIEKRE